MFKTGWIVSLLGAILLFSVFLIGGKNVSLPHAVVQIFIAVIGIGGFFVVWNSRVFIDNDFWIILGVSTLTVAILELLHAFSFNNSITTNSPHLQLLSYWIVARFVQGVSLLVATIRFGRSQLSKSNVHITMLLAGYLILIIAIIFIVNIFAEYGTAQTFYFNNIKWIVGVPTLLTFSSVLYLFRRPSLSNNHRLSDLVTISAWAAIVSVVLFCIQTDLLGFAFLPSHVLSIISIFLIYFCIQEVGVKHPNELLFRDLKISEQRFRDFTLSMADWIYETDKEFRITYCSERVTEILGFSPSEMIGSTPLAFNAPQSINDAMRWVETMSIHPRSFRNVELWYLSKASQLICFSTSGVPIYNDDELVGFRCVNQDISSRKRAEGALAESESRLRQFLESISDAVYLTKLSVEGEYEHQYISRHYETLSGYPIELFLGDWLYWPNKVIYKEDRGLAWNQFLQLASGVDSESEYRLLRANGEIIWVRDSARVRHQEDGSLIISGVISDITSRKKMEQALRESEANLSSLIETTDGSIWAIDRDYNLIVGNEDFLTTASIVFGHRIEVGDNILDQDGVSEEFRAAWLRYFERALKGESFSKQLLAEYLPDSPIIEFRFNPICDQDGDIWGVSIFGQDITARCKAEEMIQAALAEKEVLLRELHHRVKNNLNSLMALIEMQASDLDDEQSAAVLYELHGRLHTMALVHQNLYQSDDLSRVEMRPYLEMLAYNILYGWSKETPVSLKIRAEEIEFPVDIAIPCGLIVNELFTNALKYAFPQEHREQNAMLPILNIGLHRDSGQYVLFVSDNGVGLPENFDWGGSTSLGLKLVNILATRQLGGEVNLDTTQGTAFSIKFSID